MGSGGAETDPREVDSIPWESFDGHFPIRWVFIVDIRDWTDRDWVDLARDGGLSFMFVPYEAVFRGVR